MWSAMLRQSSLDTQYRHIHPVAYNMDMYHLPGAMCFLPCFLCLMYPGSIFTAGAPQLNLTVPEITDGVNQSTSEHTVARDKGLHFASLLISKYSNTSTLNRTNLEHLLKDIGFRINISVGLTDRQTDRSPARNELRDKPSKSSSLSRNPPRKRGKKSKKLIPNQKPQRPGKSRQRCLDKDDLLNVHGLVEKKTLDSLDVMYLSPAIVYQMTKRCQQRGRQRDRDNERKKESRSVSNHGDQNSEHYDENHEHDDHKHESDDHYHDHDDEDHEHDDDKHESDDHNHEHDDDKHESDDHNHEHDDRKHESDDHNHDHDDNKHESDVHDHDHVHDDHKHESNDHDHDQDDKYHGHDEHDHDHEHESNHSEHDSEKSSAHHHEHDLHEPMSNYNNNVHNHEKSSVDDDDDDDYKSVRDHEHKHFKQNKHNHDRASHLDHEHRQFEHESEHHSRDKPYGEDHEHSKGSRDHNHGTGHSHGDHQVHEDEDHGHEHNDHRGDAHGNHGNYLGAVRHHFSQIPLRVWGLSILAVSIISLVGLVSVAIIPVMTRVFYHALINFLVAMAVGALVGDALLHLLPHALSGENHENHGNTNGSHGNHSSDHPGSHGNAVWKGMCSLAGIVCFFVIERVLNIVSERKVRRKAQTKMLVVSTPRLSLADGTKTVGVKLSAHDDPDYQDCEEMIFSVNTDPKQDLDTIHCSDSLLPVLTAQPNDTEQQNQVTTAHSHSHGGHAHSHLPDSMPQSVAALAWMVIAGDGIHNLCDGLALGASFSNSITGGLSTTIAIFCHELPHEIGDFAVLLQAGMTVKQALIYNCVSSVLCFVGMIIGVAIGNVAEASLWIFAGVAGMFMYIALVDMFPEIMKTHASEGKHGFCRLLLHLVGISVGAGVMTVVAVYEENLMHIIEV